MAISLTSCGETNARPSVNALALAPRARLMVARGDAPERMSGASAESTLPGLRVEWTSSTMYSRTAGSMYTWFTSLRDSDTILVSITGCVSEMDPEVAILSRMVSSSSLLG